VSIAAEAGHPPADRSTRTRGGGGRPMLPTSPLSPPENHEHRVVPGQPPLVPFPRCPPTLGAFLVCRFRAPKRGADGLHESRIEKIRHNRYSRYNWQLRNPGRVRLQISRPLAVYQVRPDRRATPTRRGGRGSLLPSETECQQGPVRTAPQIVEHLGVGADKVRGLTPAPSRSPVLQWSDTRQ